MITRKTTLKFIETKRGNPFDKKEYEMEAGRFIDMVKDADHDGILTMINENIPDDQDIVDEFWNLPIDEQLEMCCKREGDRYASDIEFLGK